MSSKTDFGKFISEHKRKHSMKGKELAQKLGISTAYLSQLEHGTRVCPDTKLLKKLVVVLELNMEETAVLYDLYTKASGKLCPDIAEYVMSNDIVQEALRCADYAGATNKDWERFIKFLRRSIKSRSVK